MSVDFTSIQNHNEDPVCATVLAMSHGYPMVAGDDELLADVACVALNRLQPRYIRHAVDFAFYMSDREREVYDKKIAAAVEYAFGFVQARRAMRART
jgi:hypothetical protein